MHRLIGAVMIGLVLVPPVAAQRPVEFGIQTPQETASFEDLVVAWQEAERLGFRSAWLYDHFIPITGSTDGP